MQKPNDEKPKKNSKPSKPKTLKIPYQGVAATAIPLEIDELYLGSDKNNEIFIKLSDGHILKFTYQYKDICKLKDFNDKDGNPIFSYNHTFTVTVEK